MTGPAVVIIGAGIVGCALADELTGRGWTGVTVLDQGPLFVTGGSSSHTPGLVFRTDPSRTMTRLARYTVEKYARLGCFEAVGSLEVATTPERLTELHRRFGLGQSWGVGSAVVEPDACAALFPLLDRSVVLGGLHVPGDGLIPAVRAAQTQAERAGSRGARFIGNKRVSNILSENGRVTGVLTADDETLPADVVIACTGFWAAEMPGVPVLPVIRQQVRTTPAGASDGLPILRHPDRDLHFRAHGDRFGVGSYRGDPIPAGLDELPGDGHPAMLPFVPERFKQSWTAATELIPALRGTALDDASGGVLAVTADGFPLLGEAYEPRGLWTATAVEVAHSAGAAKALTEWIVDGRPGIDLRECDLHRFTAGQRAPAYLRESLSRPVRDLLVSPFHARQVELGAVFGEAGGWERPLWYGTDPPAGDARHGFPVAETEARATRRKVALFDLTAATRIELTGPVDGPPVGSVIESGAMTVARPAEHRILAVGGPLDLDRLRRHAPPGVTVRDVSAGTCGLGVWGPVARELVASLTGRRSAGQPDAWEGCLGMVPVTALRVPAVGEPGWEIYTEAGYGTRLWDTLWAAGREFGLIAAGHVAFESLRLESGWRVDPEAEDRADPDRRLACLLLAGGGEAPAGREPVYAGGFVVGHVAEAAYGWTVGAPIAYAWLPAVLAAPGTQVEIGFGGRRLAASVAAEPLFDRDHSAHSRIVR
ncbi:FAD-dependent oxidoreductase [Actinoplanes utahensis]|uniref:Sarcosine dehydrogenase n=1 Tax=Actinoplanes utahensis TaxID=1869 RepID=A0A0A6UI63_ACTUT|nr:FAD-dependent oxidoreductase [Actinoplanes utahensis]KHD74009.1 sarcosine dehydrogenase [Actinoplanes utahensis]GIF29027.1 sarcosine dehydrogenase [Actinoplanes utahensis]